MIKRRIGKLIILAEIITLFALTFSERGTFLLTIMMLLGALVFTLISYAIAREVKHKWIYFIPSILALVSGVILLYYANNYEEGLGGLLPAFIGFALIICALIAVPAYLLVYDWLFDKER